VRLTATAVAPSATPRSGAPIRWRETGLLLIGLALISVHALDDN